MLLNRRFPRLRIPKHAVQEVRLNGAHIRASGPMVYWQATMIGYKVSVQLPRLAGRCVCFRMQTGFGAFVRGTREPHNPAIYGSKKICTAVG